MQLCLTDQTDNFKKLLTALKTRPATTFDKSKLKEKCSTIDLNTGKPPDQLNLDFFFDYRIFPQNIMKFMTQWETENRKMQIGDTILQQAFIPPTKTFSQKVIFGVRINNIISESGRRGFSYVTLEGHVEKGESAFTIEKGDHGLIFKIQTFSAPGNWLTQLVGPVFTLPYQKYCTRAALRNVKREIERMNPKVGTS